ncbi:MAG: TetR family transcriptional regulator [Actinocrinis sp.]
MSARGEAKAKATNTAEVEADMTADGEAGREAEEPAAPVRPRKTGRRPGGADTRQDILDAARTEFAAHGYENTSMRAIARSAEVNAALLHHYFGTKDQLFLAALDFPLQPRALVAQVLDGERDTVGERLVRFAFALLENPASRERALAVLRAAATNEPMARLLRGFMAREVVHPVAAALDVPKPQLRAELAMTQIVGLIMGRYVLAVEPLASTPVDELIPLLGATLQRYLTATV